jgi:WD40 repeat protein
LIGDYLSGKIEYFENGAFTKIPPNFHTGAIRHLKYLPYNNGYVASASADKTVNVWDTLTFTSIQRYKNHTMTVYCLDQIDNDTMISGSDDQTIQIWKISTSETLKIINVGASVFVVRVFSVVNKQFVCGIGATSDNLRIYNYSTGVLIRTLNGHSSRVWSIEMLSEQFMASGSNDKRLVIWDLFSYTIKYTLTGHPNWVNSIKRLSSNLIASGDLDGKTFIWNWLTGERVFNLTGHTSAMYFNSLDLYDEQTLISGSADKTVKFWSISNGKLIRSINTDIQISALAVLHSSEWETIKSYFCPFLKNLK